MVRSFLTTRHFSKLLLSTLLSLDHCDCCHRHATRSLALHELTNIGPTCSGHSRILRPALVSTSARFAHLLTTSNFNCSRAARLCNHRCRVWRCLRNPPIPRLRATLHAAEWSMKVSIGRSVLQFWWCDRLPRLVRAPRIKASYSASPLDEATSVCIHDVCLGKCVECVGSAKVARLLGAHAEVRLTRAFGSGTVRQGRCRQERSVEVTVREQQRRWTKHGKGDGEMVRYAMRTANTLSHTRCLYVTQGKCVRKMCVRHGVRVHHPSHTQKLPLRGCEILRQKKILRLRRSTSTLVSPTRTLSTNLLSTDHHW